MDMEIKYDVFISYSSKDYLDKNGKEIPGDVISVIIKLFERNGVKYWIDQKDNLTGKLLTHVFSEKIRESRNILFVCSKNAVYSMWVVRELSVAFNNGKTIIPFVCDESYLDNRVTNESGALLTNKAMRSSLASGRMLASFPKVWHTRRMHLEG